MISVAPGEVSVIVNPNAGRIPSSLRTEVVAKIQTTFDAEVRVTTARGAAIDLARSAAEKGARVVVAFGGDGHVNEVANGVAGTESSLAIIPGGTMNVFARSLGLPLDPAAAIDHLERVWERRPRRVHLGKIDDRYFTFSAGCGFDAEAAERVERFVPHKRRFGELFFYWSAFRVLSGSHRHRRPTMTLRGPFGTERVAMAIACNAGPYAYLLNRPIEITPDVRLEGGIDIFALRSMRIEAFPFYAWRAAVSGDLVHHADVFYESDLMGFELEGDKPFHRHVDGEPLEPRDRATFGVAHDVLSVQV
jgi:diacylglycerol kinase family enzyme